MHDLDIIKINECLVAKNVLTNATKTNEHSNVATFVHALLQNNLTALIYSLVNALYKITTKSIKIVLDVEQSGASCDLINPTRDVQKVSFFLCILIETFHGFHRNSIG